MQNETNLVASGDKQRLLGLIPTSDMDVVLFVNSSAILGLLPSADVAPPQGSPLAVPNHYALMTAPFVEGDDPAWIDIDVWSWGKRMTGWQGSDRLITNYFRLVTASV